MSEQHIETVCALPERLDVFVAEAAEITRSRAGALIKDGCVTADGAVQTKAGYKLRAGSPVTVRIPEAAPSSVEAEDIDLDVVYQDDDVAVVFKPSGMVVHPAAGNESGTLVCALGLGPFIAFFSKTIAEPLCRDGHSTEG